MEPDLDIRFAVLAPTSEISSGHLLQISPHGVLEREVPVGYSAEVRFQANTRELVVLESDASENPMRYYLRVLDPASMSESARREIPVRPMYAGFPGRSVGGSLSRSGRYLYFLRSGPVIRHEDDDLTFRLTAMRWDRQMDVIEEGQFFVESCHVDYGICGDSEDSLYFHLSCECSSTIAPGSFHSPRCDLVRMENLPRRQHGPHETNGSWLDAARCSLYCVNRKGTIYEVRLQEKTSRILAHLQLGPGLAVPLHQIYGAAGSIFVGVAKISEYMGFGMVTEIMSVAADTGEFHAKLTLPQPVISFVVTPDGKRIAAVNPYTRAVFCLNSETGEEVWSLPGLVKAPGEIIIIY
jgi:hypothetical protein